MDEQEHIDYSTWIFPTSTTKIIIISHEKGNSQQFVNIV